MKLGRNVYHIREDIAVKVFKVRGQRSRSYVNDMTMEGVALGSVALCLTSVSRGEGILMSVVPSVLLAPTGISRDVMCCFMFKWC